MGIGTETVATVEGVCRKLAEEYLRSIVFMGRLIFREQQPRGSLGLARSVLRERVVGIAVQPPLPGLGRSHDGMSAGPRVLARVAVRRGVAAQGHAATLAGAKMNPLRPDLYAFLALSLLRPA